MVAAFTWALTAQDAADALTHVGPVVIGVNWYLGCMDVDGNGFVNLTGAVQGGHELCLRGYDPVAHVFLGRNSWSKAWGHNGDFLLRFADLARLLSEGGDACVGVKA